MKRLLEKYKFIEEIINEYEDGYWCYLKEGYIAIDNTQTIHCNTLKELEQEIRQVEKIGGAK